MKVDHPEPGAEIFALSFGKRIPVVLRGEQQRQGDRRHLDHPLVVIPHIAPIIRPLGIRSGDEPGHMVLLTIPAEPAASKRHDPPEQAGPPLQQRHLLRVVGGFVSHEEARPSLDQNTPARSEKLQQGGRQRCPVFDDDLPDLMSVWNHGRASFSRSPERHRAVKLHSQRFHVEVVAPDGAFIDADPVRLVVDRMEEDSVGFGDRPGRVSPNQR